MTSFWLRRISAAASICGFPEPFSERILTWAAPRFPPSPPGPLRRWGGRRYRAGRIHCSALDFPLGEPAGVPRAFAQRWCAAPLLPDAVILLFYARFLPAEEVGGPPGTARPRLPMRSGRRSRGRRTPSPCGLAPVPHSASWLVGVLPLLHEGVLSHTFAAYARVTLPRAKYCSALFLQPRHPNPPEFQISFEEFPLPRGPVRVRPRLGLGGDPRLVLHSVEKVLQLVVSPYLP